MLLSFQSEIDNNKVLTMIGTDARNKEIWIMINQISLATDLINAGRLVLASMDHLDLKNSKNMEWKEVNCLI